MLEKLVMLSNIELTELWFLMSIYSSCSRDGSIPVSFIQKLLMKKLGLKSEDEVSLCWICRIHSYLCKGSRTPVTWFFTRINFHQTFWVLAFAVLLSLKFSACLFSAWHVALLYLLRRALAYSLKLLLLQVEIKCMGHPVLPSLQVQNLVELWLDTASTGHRIPATIGSSGKDFVMILTYGRKVQQPSSWVANSYTM